MVDYFWFDNPGKMLYKGCVDRLFASYQQCLKSWEAFPCAFTTRVFTVRRVFLAQRPAFISKGPVVRDGFGITIVQADPRGSDAIGLFRETGHAPFGQRPQTACKLLASKDDGAAFIDLGCLHIVSGEGDEEYVFIGTCFFQDVGVNVWLGYDPPIPLYTFGTLLMAHMPVQVFL